MSENAVTKLEHEESHSLSADPMVTMIERVVLNPNADLDKLERMLAMKDRMDEREARISFARALSAARAEIPPIVKDAQVDFTTAKGRTQYKHETLAGIAKVIDPILSQHGLSYRFRTDQGNGGVRVTCIITHSSGHYEETSLAGAPDGSGSKNSFQAVGSAVTYLQRYTLKAALGLSAEVDDDGQGAAPRPGEQRQERRNSGPAPEAIEEAKKALGAAESMEALQDTWLGIANPVKAVAAVITAKDKRKSELSKPPETKTPDEQLSEELDDHIPHQ